jgi:hypothetical protein
VRATRPQLQLVCEEQAAVLWTIGSLFFLWLGVREIYFRFIPRSGFDRPTSSIWWPYVALMLAISAALAYTPIQNWKIERFLTQKARILAEKNTASVHCNDLIDSLLSLDVFGGGHADPESGRIVLKNPRCGQMIDYLAEPGKATLDDIYVFHVFTHEAMHARGEYNEAITECQAVQRFVRAAVLFGVSEDLARKQGMIYYNSYYKKRGAIGGDGGRYYSDECAPGKALDEKLSDSTWQ